ncbi:DUF1294 domain-containing protein [Bacillaceae bacterium SIJ1]|nr:DUF1294 domain-containing protein [Litoribacterium kuwaitense]
MCNGYAFLLMALDKKKAKAGSRRIRERSLWKAAWLFGAAGALAGMYAYRHKTKHRSFVWGMPLLLFLQIMIFVFGLSWWVTTT